MKKGRRLFTLLAVLFAATLLMGCGEKKVTITFDYNDGVTPNKVVEIKKGQSIIEMPANPTREGYNFVGWETKGEDFDQEAAIKGNISVIAVWERLFNVTFNLNYDGETVVVDAVPGDKIDFLEVEDRLGYDFMGWFTDNAVFSNPWDFDNDVMGNRAMTLYAKWESYAIIEGVSDITFLIGDEELDLLEGVTAHDLFEMSNLEVTVDVGDLDFTQEGVYEVTYSSFNYSGKESLKTITVTVAYENRLLIKYNDVMMVQQVLIQVKEKLLGFELEIAYQVRPDSEIPESNLNVIISEAFGTWIDDINIENGIISIAATGLDNVDAYLLTELLRISAGFDLELISLKVDTIEENGLIIK